MKKIQEKWIVVFISLTILLTICAQIFSNVKHYETNKHLLYKQIHFSLDKALENYFINLAKDGMSFNVANDSINKLNPNAFPKEIKQKIDSTLSVIQKKDGSKKKANLFTNNNPKNFQFHFNRFISKLYFSYTHNSLDLKKLDGYFKKEFKKNHIKIQYAFTYQKRLPNKKIKILDSLYFTNFPKNHARIHSNSNFFRHRGTQLVLHYTDENALLLKRSLFEIFLSLVLSLSIIACLLYLKHTINKQKKVAAIKNDFISNITHEFKTPIATIHAALEGIQSFNRKNDLEKTKRYLGMAHLQLGKLNEMVEKLLDTATLDSDNLTIQTQKTDLVKLIKNLLHNHQLIHSEASIEFQTSATEIAVCLDEFHFENALNNIIDNAFKYGGTHIKTTIASTEKSVTIKITDNGLGIDKKHADKIFDQFYRIQQGNIHTTKGFGIGLYYAKKIIEKHKGSLTFTSEPNRFTTFKIELYL